LNRLLRSKKDMLFLAVVFLLSAGLFYAMRMSAGKGVNADETSNFYVGKDFVNGNFLLQGWHFSTGLFLLPALAADIFTNIFGYHDSTFFLLASLNYAFLITISLFAVYKVAKLHVRSCSLRFTLIAAFLIFVPRADMLYNSGTHILCVAVSIAFFYVFYKESRNQNLACAAVYVRYFLLCLLMGILAVSNTMFLYSAIIPVILTGVCVSVIERSRRGVLHYSAPGVLAVVFQMILNEVWQAARDGNHFGSTPAVFVQKENLWDSILESLCNTVQLFGIDIWTKEVASRETVIACIGICTLLKLIVELFKFFRGPKDRHADLIYLFLMMAFVNLAAYAFSTLALTYRSTHLIFPCLIGIVTGGILAWVENIQTFASKEKWKVYLGLAFFLFAAMSPGISLKQPEAYEMKVAEYLTAHGYQNGYGGFWSATTTMYYAGYYGNENLNIAPLLCANQRLQLYEWMVPDDQSRQQANFFVCSRRDLKQYEISDAKIERTFGKWDRKLEFDGGILLYLWDHTLISTNGLYGSGSYLEQMELSDPEKMQSDAGIKIHSSDVMYGPYLYLPKGTYNLIVEADNSKDTALLITTQRGAVELDSFILKDGRNHYTFQLDKDSYDVEFVVRGIQALEDDPLVIRKIQMGRADGMDYRADLWIDGEHAIANTELDSVLKTGQKMYGPYFNLEEGSYELNVRSTGSETDLKLMLTSNHGQNSYGVFPISKGENHLSFYLPKHAEQVKFVLENVGEKTITVQSIGLSKRYEIELADTMDVKAQKAVSSDIMLEKGIYCLNAVARKNMVPINVQVVGTKTNAKWIDTTLSNKENHMIFTVDSPIEPMQVQLSGWKGGSLDLNHIWQTRIVKLSFMEYIQSMQLSSDLMRQADGSVVLEPEDMVFGPYAYLDRGWYCLRINLLEASIGAQVTIRNNMENMDTFSLAEGENLLNFYLKEGTENVEFVIQNGTENRMRIDHIALAVIQEE